MVNFKKIHAKQALGVGCWAIGGPFYSLDGIARGWGEVDDAVSTKALHAALDHGVVHFDTAQAYGAGHSETVLGQALKGRDVAIATKIGLEINGEKKLITGPMTDPVEIKRSLVGSLRRLQRDHIDLVLLHLNQLEKENADPIFDALDDMIQDGKVGSFGWSTDFPENASPQADRLNFTAVEHAMNVFLPASGMCELAKENNLVALIRSPLAMGVLTGKYDSTTRFSKDDIRNTGDASNTYLMDGRITETALSQREAVRDILQSNGRSIAQGALAWLWARSANTMPIPGVRTAEQATDLCGALDAGPLTPEQMIEIEQILERPEAEDIREL